MGSSEERTSGVSKLAGMRERDLISRQQLADKIALDLGISSKTMYNKILLIERGQILMRNVSLRIALAIAEALEVDPRDLLDADGDVPQNQ